MPNTNIFFCVTFLLLQFLIPICSIRNLKAINPTIYVKNKQVFQKFIHVDLLLWFYFCFIFVISAQCKRKTDAHLEMQSLNRSIAILQMTLCQATNIGTMDSKWNNFSVILRSIVTSHNAPHSKMHAIQWAYSSMLRMYLNIIIMKRSNSRPLCTRASSSEHVDLHIIIIEHWTCKYCILCNSNNEIAKCKAFVVNWFQSKLVKLCVKWFSHGFKLVNVKWNGHA